MMKMKNNPNRSDHMEDIFSSNTIPPIEPEKPEQGQIPTPDVAPTTAFIPQQTQSTPDQNATNHSNPSSESTLSSNKPAFSTIYDQYGTSNNGVFP